MTKNDDSLAMAMALLLLACGSGVEFNSEQKMNLENLENSLWEDEKVQKAIKEHIITSLIMSKDFYLENEFNNELNNSFNKHLIEATNISIAYKEYLKAFKDFFDNYHKYHDELLNNVIEFSKWQFKQKENKTFTKKELQEKLDEYDLDIINQGFGSSNKLEND